MNHARRQFAPRLIGAAATRRAGLTLIELLLGLAGTGFVAAATVAMLFAVNKGVDSRTDLRSAIVQQKTLTGRISAAIRSSRMVLAATDDAVVLWMADSNGDGSPNLAEIRLIERDAGAREIASYTAPPGLALAANTTYPLASTDFAATTAALKGSAQFPRTLWATGISGWSLALNSATVQSASLMSYRVSLAAGGLEQTVAAAAAVRNR